MDSCVDWYAVDQGVDAAAYVRSLATLRKGARGTVISVGVGIDGAAGVMVGDVAGSTIVRRLLEIGFVPGEQIEIIEEIRPGGDPIAVRIGTSMFALRRREAQAVLVRLERPEAV
jgi:ferrous iron transport protein A